MKQYRIKPKRGGYGYKIQSKRWWFPFWVRVGFFAMLDFTDRFDAKQWIEETENPMYIQLQKEKTI